MTEHVSVLKNLDGPMTAVCLRCAAEGCGLKAATPTDTVPAEVPRGALPGAAGLHVDRPPLRNGNPWWREHVVRGFWFQIERGVEVPFTLDIHFEEPCRSH